MGINYFTDEQVELLRKNKYVKRVSNKSITYTHEFKLFFINEYDIEPHPTQIFAKAGFDVKALGTERIKSRAKFWRKNYINGISLTDSRKGNSGRPKTKDLTPEEIIERQKLQIETMKQEIEFLRQIRRLERRYQPKQSPSKKNTK